MRLIAVLLLCSLSFGNYNSEHFDMLGKTISVPPPIWMDNELNGPDVDFKEYGDDRHYKLYQFIPDNESWDDFSKMLSIAVAKMNPDKTYPFISYVEEKVRGYRVKCEGSVSTTVPHLSDSEAIIVSACGRLPDDMFANKGFITITYFSVRDDIRIIVASEFFVEPFSPIFINDWPISVATLNEATARMLAVTVIKD